MNKKTLFTASLITALAIIFLILIGFAIFKNQPEGTISGGQTEETSDDSVLGEKAIERGWVINSLGYSYLYYDRALLQFNGTAYTGQRYADVLNRFAAKINCTQVFSITVPTQAEYLDIPIAVMAEDNFYCNSQKEAVFASSLAMNTVKNIDIYDILYAHKDEYIYFRTDYNWTALGAYYAYTDYCKAANLQAVPLENYEAVELENYLGWFYTATKSQMLLDNADTIVYYRIEKEHPCYITTYEDGYKTHTLKYIGTELSAASGYNVFVGEEKPVYKLETRSKGGTLAIIGDTSAHAFIPFLLPHYKEIYLYNPNMRESTDEIDINADTVLFLSYATNANSTVFCENIERLYEK